MKKIIQIKLFLSSPSDVSEERKIVENVIMQINKNEGLENSYNIHVYKWEDDYTPDWMPYQEQINEELKDTDIYVGILWNRFGSPTLQYTSGTEEEFEITRKLVEKGAKVELCFYRCIKKGEIDEGNNEQLEQRKKVNDFFKKYDNKKFGLFQYKEIAVFKDKFRNDVLSKVKTILNRTNHLINTNIDFGNNGITKFYIPELDRLRNEDKEEFLKTEEGDICLLAHTGNAYLHTPQDGSTGIFFHFVRQRLCNKPYKLKVLLLNPYSLEARKIFYAENFNSYRNDILSIKVTELENGINYLRFEKCIQGIKEIKKELGENSNRLEVRITNVATDGTILMSNSKLFYEPYVVSRLLSRVEKKLNLFEIQVKNLLNNKQCSSIYNKQICAECENKFICENNLYKILAEQFYILWETSISLTEYEGSRDKYKEDFIKTQHGLFYKQIVQLHDSWFAFDPIIGCNGNCIYCFLGHQGWQGTTPHLRNSPNEDEYIYLEKAYKEQLLEYPQYVNSSNYDRKKLGNVPISIGNKTDMLFTSNKKYLKYILDLHNQENTKRPLVFITKQKIDLKIIDIIKNYPFDVIFLYSIAFLPKDFEPNTPSYKARLESAKKIRKKIKNENIKNIHLIHYWRPIIKFTKDDIDNVLEQIGSIFDCSVCVGLKLNEEIFKSIKHSELSKYISSKTKSNDDIKNGIEIMEPSFEEIQKVAKKYSHPVFQHTSCALSYIQEKADFNGSMWRENFCNNCVQIQKYRCKLFKINWDKNKYISLLDKKVGYDSYSFKEDCIKIDSAISQEEINFLTHSIGKPIFSDSVQLTLVWPSSNQIYYKKKYSYDVFESVKTEYSILTEQLERLKGITGFISILGDNNRVNAFNRYDHVNRVVRLLKWYINDLKDLDSKKCAFLGLFHDINRLPFAHNIEKAINFSQSETIHDYMKLFSVAIDETYYKDFDSFFNKDLNGSRESRIVYLIDSVEGFIEDVLFALATLNMVISEDILSILGFDNKIMLEQDLSRLKELYNNGDINLFREEFGDISFENAKAFINKYKSKEDEYKIFNDDEFIEIKKTIINELLINQVFPINNEIVSKGSKLALEIGIPYIRHLEENNQNAFFTLFKQTDKELLEEVVSTGIIANEKDYYPNLNP